MKVLQFPLARITFFFIAGILVANYRDISIKLSLLLLVAGCVFFVMVYQFVKLNYIGNVNFRNIIFGIVTYSLSFLIGIFTEVTHNDFLNPGNYMSNYREADKPHLIQGSVIEKLKSSPYKDRYIFVVKELDHKPCNGKLLLYIQKENSKKDFKGNSDPDVGAILLIKGVLSKHRPPINPNQFDYGRYLSNKSITAQMYVNPTDIKIARLKDKSTWYYAAHFRNRILNNLKKSNFKTDELNVAAALILGQQQDISKEILHDYQYAGAVHVLSVSGLHVGYIMLFINFILSGVAHNKNGNLVRLSFTLVALWIFAVIAGLSPSIIRSVTMFSFLAVGMYLKRETNVFHTLIVSVLLILVVSPSFLFDVGFQLSYVSLFFILWLQPLLSGMWHPTHKVSKYLWDIVTVSFAAQIGAFPLSIYYFHQFPGLFFITNIVILPGLGIIMALGVFVMLMATFDYVPQLPMSVLEWLIYLLNTVIRHIASLEQFIIKDIPLTIYLLLSLYLAISSIIFWLEKPRFKQTLLALSALMVVQLSIICTLWLNQYKSEYIVFHITKKTILAKRNGRQVVLYTDDSLIKNVDNEPMVKSYLTANFIDISHKKSIPDTEYFRSMKILITDSSAVYPKYAKPDLIILTQSPKFNLERLLNFHHPKKVIADGSNYKSYVALWKATCKKQKIPFHATAEKGFYKLD